MRCCTIKQGRSAIGTTVSILQGYPRAISQSISECRVEHNRVIVKFDKIKQEMRWDMVVRGGTGMYCGETYAIGIVARKNSEPQMSTGTAGLDYTRHSDISVVFPSQSGVGLKAVGRDWNSKLTMQDSICTPQCIPCADMHMWLTMALPPEHTEVVVGPNAANISSLCMFHGVNFRLSRNAAGSWLHIIGNEHDCQATYMAINQIQNSQVISSSCFPDTVITIIVTRPGFTSTQSAFRYTCMC